MGPHPVEVEMGLPAWEILDVIKRSDRCYQTVRGYVAERHLEKLLEKLKGSGAIQQSVYVNKDGQPDFRVTLHGQTKTIECKNVMSKTRYANGDLKVDFQRTRNQLGTGARIGRYYKVTDFDILSACEHNQCNSWNSMDRGCVVATLIVGDCTSRRFLGHEQRGAGKSTTPGGR